MFHPNKNKLLQLFENEGSERELKALHAHVADCPRCAQYLQRLQRIEKALNQLDEATPPSHSFILIQNEIRRRAALPVPDPPAIRMRPLIQIMGVIGTMLTLVFIIQRWLIPTAVWDRLQECELVTILGQYGSLLVLVFVLISFFVLAFTPILILEKNKTVFPAK